MSILLGVLLMMIMALGVITMITMIVYIGIQTFNALKQRFINYFANRRGRLFVVKAEVLGEALKKEASHMKDKKVASELEKFIAKLKKEGTVEGFENENGVVDEETISFYGAEESDQQIKNLMDQSQGVIILKAKGA